MNAKLWMMGLLVVTSGAQAEVMNCNVSGSGMVTLINVDVEAKTVIMTDNFGRDIPGKITLLRKANKGRNRINAVLEYKPNNTPIYIDMLIEPIEDEEYKVGMAGYIDKDGKRLLDLTSSDKAMCF